MESSQLQGVFSRLNSWEDESFESWEDEFTVVIIGETLGFTYCMLAYLCECFQWWTTVPFWLTASSPSSELS